MNQTKISCPEEALAALRTELPDWTPVGSWGLRTRVRGEMVELAVTARVDADQVSHALIVIESPIGRTFHATVEGALARARRLVV